MKMMKLCLLPIRVIGAVTMLTLALTNAYCQQLQTIVISEADMTAFLDCSGRHLATLDQLTRDAISENKTVAEEAIRQLRGRGPEGLRALTEANAVVLKQHAAAGAFGVPSKPDESWLRLKAALDGVSSQHDCHASQLYWFTDFEQAKVAAKAENKPILSLRLLGKLDEEYSCANSRFFRTTLYANTEVGKYLREHFILHWKSVRPVPRVTIDFGDGRKLERTLTGNSIHYVLDSDGNVVDALPGLYGAKAFIAGLQRTEQTVHDIAAKPAGQREPALREYHRSRLATIEAEWAADLKRLNSPVVMNSLSSNDVFQPFLLAQASVSVENFPSATVAASRAVGKGRAEMPILRGTQPGTPSGRRGLNAATDDETWNKIAMLHLTETSLDSGVIKLIQDKNPNAFAANRLSASKAFTETPLLRSIRNLERSIAEDTVRNEYQLHAQIHEWLASGSAPMQLDQLNTKVYAELFLTPDSDPWLGLLPRDTISALPDEGMITAAKQ